MSKHKQKRRTATFNDDTPKLHTQEFDEKRIFSPTLKSATLEEIVVKLVLDQDDSKFLHNFLATYQLICTAETLLTMLKEWYKEAQINFKQPEKIKPDRSVASELHIPDRLVNRRLSYSGSCGQIFSTATDNSSRIRLNIANIFKVWIGNFFDFYDNANLYGKLVSFVNRIKKSKDKSHSLFATIVQEALNSFNTQKQAYEGKIIFPTVMATQKQAYFPILGGKATLESLAEQLTLFEYDIIRNIRINDILKDGALLDEEHGKIRNSFTIYSNHSKKMRDLFISEIINEPSPKQCKQFIKKAIRIADLCFNLRNYNTVMEILSALYSPLILTSCEKSLEEISNGKAFKTLEELSEQFSSLNNYERYRALVGESESPTIPFLGVHIGDIRFINDFNNTESLNGYNIIKMNQLGEEINKLKKLFVKEFPFSTTDATMRERIAENFNYLPEMLKNHKRVFDSNITVSERLQKFKMIFDNFHSSNILGREDFNFTDFRIRSRDWALILSKATFIDIKANHPIVDHDVHETVLIVKEGKVGINRADSRLRDISGPCVLFANKILETKDTLTATSLSECKLAKIEKDLLVSLLESDAYLSLRFFLHIATQLIDQLYDYNVISQSNKHSLTKSKILARSTGHLVVKPNSTESNPNIFTDPKQIRDVEFRKIFHYQDKEIIIKEYKAALLGSIHAQGTLIISQNYVSFYAKMFNHKTKISVPVADITTIERKKNKLSIIAAIKTRKLAVKLKEGEDEEAHDLLENIKNSSKGIRRPSITESTTASLGEWRNAQKSMNNLGLSGSDWDLLLRGAKRIVFKKNDVLMKEGVESQRIFQLIRGYCRIEKKSKTEKGEQSYVVGQIVPTEIFGEISFIQKNKTTAAVLAQSEEVEVLVIEGYYIKRLLEIHPELAGRFFHYICCVLQRRLNRKLRYEDNTERIVADLITEPLYHNLINHSVIPPISLSPLETFNGPSCNEEEENENFTCRSNGKAAVTSISTYPLSILGPEQVERQGNPICDQYKLEIYPTRMILAVADGCNWGEAPRNAARAAINAFTRYLENHQGEIRDVQTAGALILRALSMANAEIFVGLDIEKNIIGTTTFLGGFVLQLDEDAELKGNEKSERISLMSSDQFEINSSESYENFQSVLDTPEFGLVYISLGDCKAFHWSAETGKFTDITANNRVDSQSASDCGGRLGPHEAGNLPDLRNLELGFFPCRTGDCLIFVSDGVHDNLDPTHLGYQPRDIGIEADNWDACKSCATAETIKNKYMISLLEKIIYDQFETGTATKQTKQLPTAPEIVSRILKHCRDTCASASQWMTDNPKSRLPKDYRLYPGKMDHTTVLCTFIGERN